MKYKPFLNEETRTSVLNGVRDGTQAAWRRFFDLYAGYVYSLGRRAGFQGTDADDLVQVVFTGLAAPGGFDGYERGKGSFRSWLRRRVGWRILDEQRRRAAEPARDNSIGGNLDALCAPDNAALDEAWIEAAREEALERLRTKVSPTHFAVFQASVLEELPAEDVLALYNISSDNLYQIRRRVKAIFATLLKEALDDLDAPTPPP